MALPAIRYTARDFQTIKAALGSYIQATRLELWTDFFESNLGVALLELIAYVGDILSFTQDRVAQEVFLATCKRIGSALRFADSVGYRPSGRVSSSVDLYVDPLPGGGVALTDVLRVAKGITVSSGSTTYETPVEYIFALGTPIADVHFTVVEGRETTDSFTGSGLPNQQVTTASGNISDGSWSVTVNGIEWTETTNLLLNLAENVYQTRYNDAGAVTIQFGDGIHGNIPLDGSSIAVTYRPTMGAAGMISGGVIDTRVPATFGATLVQIEVTNPNASTGGADAETLEHIKAFLPSWIRTVDKAITLADYNALSGDFADPAYGAVGKAVAVRRDWGTGPTILSVVTDYLDLPDGSLAQPYPAVGTYYIVRDISGAAPSGAGLYRWNGAAWDYVACPAFLANNIIDVYIWAPSGNTYGPASVGLIAALQTYLTERSCATVHTVVQNGILTGVNLDLGVITCDAAYDLNEIAANVQTAIENLFKAEDHQPGSTFRLSHLYDAIQDVPGVLHFVVNGPATDVPSGATELLVVGTISASYVTGT